MERLLLVCLAGGIGSVMTVTASFGLVAVAQVLKRLADASEGASFLKDLFEATNAEEFCISCHEMRDNVYQE